MPSIKLSGAERRAGVRYLFAEEWSRRIAAHFLEWLGLGAQLRWLDVGCGAGPVSEIILQRHDPSSLIGVDPASGAVEAAQARLADPRARFSVADGMNPSFPDGLFDVAVSGLAMHLVPDAPRMTRRMARAARAGGTVGLYVWDYAGRMQASRHFWAAATALNPAIEEISEANRFPICRREALAKLFLGAGLRAVRTRAIDARVVLRSFDDFWTAVSEGSDPTALYCRSLCDGDRAALRESLARRVPKAEDGSVPIALRAWAVSGVV